MRIGSRKNAIRIKNSVWHPSVITFGDYLLKSKTKKQKLK